MKIVFASYAYSPEYNDPQSWLQRIDFYTGILTRLAFKHTIISIEQIDHEGIYPHQGVQYHFKKLTKLGRNFPFKLHGYIKGFEPDVVFIHGLHFSHQIIQLRLHLGANVKIIAQHHAEQPYRGFKKLMQQLADKCINAYLFASRDMGLEWVKRGNIAKPEKIHQVMEVSSVFGVIDKRIALSKTGISGSPVFLWVGRLNQNKDPLTVVRAFLQYARSNTAARLYMIYQTEELLSQIIKLIECNPLGKETITLVGKIQHPELLYWFNSADFMISGSHYEGSSVVVCEAMSCGVIPIVTDILSFKMMTDNGKCGFLYQPGNQVALLASLLQTEAMGVTAKREACLRFYKYELSFEAIAGKIEQVALSL